MAAGGYFFTSDSLIQGLMDYTYYNFKEENIEVYGLLYGFIAFEDDNLCPTGWHISTDQDWTQLEEYLGGADIAGGKLKSINSWYMPNIGATNEIGFSALPGKYRDRGCPAP